MSNNGWKVGDNAPNSVQIDDLKELVGIPVLQEEVNGKAEIEHTHKWGDIEDIPTTFPVATHTHAISGVTNLEEELNKRTTKRILTYTLTTDANGVASVEYATPFSAVPNVHLDLTPSDSIRNRVRITSSTASGFSIIAEQQDVDMLSLPGVDILTASASPISGATVRATIIESA